MSKQNIRWSVDDLNETQLALVGQDKSRTKYNAKKTVIDNITFDSKKEAHYYEQLKLDPDVKFFLRQVPFDLPGNVRYRIDFVVFQKNGVVRFVDVKGMKTDIYKLKKKQVEALYPVKIEEV